MKKLQILGTGCPKCRQLCEEAAKAVSDNKFDAEVVKISDIGEITAMGVMMTPALALDGKILSSGKVLSASEIAGLLRENGVATYAAEVQPDSKCGSSCSCSCASAAKGQSSCCCGGGSGKKILTFILLGIVAVSVFAVVMREMRSPAKAEPAKNEKCSADAYSGATPSVKAHSTANVTTVYYFYGNKRCSTCNKIETLTKAAVNAGFADDLKSGAVVFKSVNVDEAENQHFVKDFELASRCVVVQNGTKFERLEKVWELVGNEPEFTKYIRQGIEKIRAEKK